MWETELLCGHLMSCPKGPHRGVEDLSNKKLEMNSELLGAIRRVASDSLE